LGCKDARRFQQFGVTGERALGVSVVPVVEADTLTWLDHPSAAVAPAVLETETIALLARRSRDATPLGQAVGAGDELGHERTLTRLRCS
jgi:hypothetical protein